MRGSPRRRRARLRGLAGASAPPPARVPSPGGISIDRLCYRASSLLNPSRLLVAPRTRRLARRWTAAPRGRPRADPGGGFPRRRLGRARGDAGDARARVPRGPRERVPRRVRSNAPIGRGGPRDEDERRLRLVPAGDDRASPRPHRGPPRGVRRVRARVVAPAPARAPAPVPAWAWAPGDGEVFALADPWECRPYVSPPVTSDEQRLPGRAETLRFVGDGETSDADVGEAWRLGTPEDVAPGTPAAAAVRRAPYAAVAKDSTTAPFEVRCRAEWTRGRDNRYPTNTSHQTPDSDVSETPRSSAASSPRSERPGSHAAAGFSFAPVDEGGEGGGGGTPEPFGRRFGEDEEGEAPRRGEEKKTGDEKNGGEETELFSDRVADAAGPSSHSRVIPGASTATPCAALGIVSIFTNKFMQARRRPPHRAQFYGGRRGVHETWDVLGGAVFVAGDDATPAGGARRSGSGGRWRAWGEGLWPNALARLSEDPPLSEDDSRAVRSPPSSRDDAPGVDEETLSRAMARARLRSPNRRARTRTPRARRAAIRVTRTGSAGGRSSSRDRACAPTGASCSCACRSRRGSRWSARAPRGRGARGEPPRRGGTIEKTSTRSACTPGVRSGLPVRLESPTRSSRRRSGGRRRTPRRLLGRWT